MRRWCWGSTRVGQAESAGVVTELGKQYRPGLVKGNRGRSSSRAGLAVPAGSGRVVSSKQDGVAE